MKHVMYGLALIAGCLLIGMVVLAMTFDTAGLQKRIEQAVSEQTGKALHLTSAPHLSFFPLGISCEGIRWGEATDELSFEAQSASVHVAFLPLLHGEIVLNKISLDAPFIRMKKNAPAPTESLKNLKTADAAIVSSVPAKAPANPQRLVHTLRLDAVNITKGTLIYEHKGTMLTLKNVSFTMNDFAFDSPSEITLNADVDVPDLPLVGHATLEGSFILGKSVRFEKMQLRYTPKQGLGASGAKPLPLEALGQGEFTFAPQKLVLNSLHMALGASTLDMASTVVLDETLDARATIQATLQPALLAMAVGSALPPARIDFAGSLHYTPDTLSIADLHATLSSPNVEKTTLKGAFQIDMPQKSPWSIQSTLDVDILPLDAYLTGTKTTKKDTQATTPAPSAKNTRTPLNGEAMPALDIRLSCAKVLYSGLMAENIAMRLAGARGTYTLLPARLNISGGRVDLQGRIHIQKNESQNADAPDIPQCALSGSIRAVQLEPVLQKIIGERISGLLSSDFSVTAAGLEPTDLLATLNGKGFVQVDSIDLHKFNLFPAKEPLGKTALGGLTRFQSLNIPFSIKNGLATLSDTRLVGEGLNAVGSGWVNLNKRTLEYKTTITQKHLNIVMPLVVWGSFEKPHFRIEPKDVLRELGRLGKNLRTKDDVRALGKELKNLFGK